MISATLSKYLDGTQIYWACFIKFGLAGLTVLMPFGTFQISRRVGCLLAWVMEGGKNVWPLQTINFFLQSFCFIYQKSNSN